MQGWDWSFVDGIQSAVTVASRHMAMTQQSSKNRPRNQKSHRLLPGLHGSSFVLLESGAKERTKELGTVLLMLERCGPSSSTLVLCNETFCKDGQGL